MKRRKVPEERKMIFNLLTTKDTSLVGDVGELLVKRYLWRKMRFMPHNFSLKKKWIEKIVRDKAKLKYLMDYKGRYWDLIGVKHRYKSRYGRRRIENAAVELRAALREKDEQKTKAKEEELAQLLKKFRIEEVYLIEVKTVREGAIRHDLNPTAKHKIGDVEEAKAHSFEVLLVIVTLFGNWKYECECIVL